ncbi:hypothetical protein MMC28_000128 [Mycoblastus sanguinarius]|nr:hypothetical protein [Mycoblastus sanguinarius]
MTLNWLTQPTEIPQPPQLSLDELFTPTMNGLNHLFSDSSAPNKQNGSSPVPLTGTSRRSHEYDTPVKQQSNSASRVASPSLSEADLSLNSPQYLSNMGTPTSELGGVNWSSAVGRATTGKSGRVIEKLMGDNDRLSREKKLATVKLDEEVKRSESARSALETLQISNANLLSMHETDKGFLSKKDRRIEELRSDLEAERLRREKAEKETRESRREREEAVEKLRRDAAEDREQARRSNSQYEVLSRSWKCLEEQYERQTQKLKADLKCLRTEIDNDQQKLARLEVIMEQLRQEGEKSRRAKEKLSSDFQAYKVEQEVGVRGIKERAEKNNAANNRTFKQMESLLGEMRYVLNVKKNVRGVE